MHVVLLTQYFPPEVGAPQQRLGYLARRLLSTGHSVTVVTGMPNYPTGRVFEGWRGRLASRDETEFGTVMRTWLYASAKRDTPRQLANYATFVASVAATAPFRLQRADVVIWESPPLFLAPAAWALARRLRARLVMNVSDLWPQSAVDLGLLAPGGRLLGAVERLETWAYQTADLVSGQTEGILKGVQARPTASTYLFPNGVDLQAFAPRPPDMQLRARLGVREGGLLVGYMGNFGRAQALEQVVHGARLLAGVAPDVRLVLVGDGPTRPSVDELVRQESPGNLTLLPSVPHSEVPAMLASLDAALVPLADRPVFEGARPSKLFEILAMGIPVVYAGRGEGARLAAASGAAVVVSPQQPDELAGALARLATRPEAERRAMGASGRDFVAVHFDRARLTDKYINRIAELP